MHFYLGRDCGATFIDAAFETLVKQRLRGLDDVLNYTVEQTSFEMRCSRDYKQNKHCVGKEGYRSEDKLRIKIPDMRQRITDTSRGIEDGQMIFTWQVPKRAKGTGRDTGLEHDPIQYHSLTRCNVQV